jgi:nucleoside-diphosphate-sugar epimerase
MGCREPDDVHRVQATAGGLLNPIIGRDDLVLVTGASGFIGRRVLENLLTRGHRNVRCLVRPSGDRRALERVARYCEAADRVEVMIGNLLSPEDCARAAAGAAVIYHLAAGRADMFAEAFMNSVVTTRNLLQATVAHGCLKRFVNVSSFSVYSNRNKRQRRLLDESCPVEIEPAQRWDPYMYGKTKQDEIVMELGDKLGIPYVIVRPGYVYGAGHETISDRVGISTFGIFLHLGGSNAIPLTYVDNCAEAIVLAGFASGVEGEIFNVVDDELPSSRRFLRLYKKNVGWFSSIYVPHLVSYVLCCLWEKYSHWSQGQLPPVFNHRGWHAIWKKTRYTNAKVKERLGWSPRVPLNEALNRYFASCRERARHA